MDNKSLVFEMARLRTVFDLSPERGNEIAKQYFEVTDEIRRRCLPIIFTDHPLEKYELEVEKETATSSGEGSYKPTYSEEEEEDSKAGK